MKAPHVVKGPVAAVDPDSLWQELSHRRLVDAAMPRGTFEDALSFDLAAEALWAGFSGQAIQEPPRGAFLSREDDWRMRAFFARLEDADDAAAEIAGISRVQPILVGLQEHERYRRTVKEAEDARERSRRAALRDAEEESRAILNAMAMETAREANFVGNSASIPNPFGSRGGDPDSKKKETHQAVTKKGKTSTELKKPDSKYQNNAIKKQDIIIEKYGSMDAYYDVAPIKPKCVDKKEIYITAEGLAMPCCWTAGRMYKWWHKDPYVEQIWTHIDIAGGKNAIDARNGLKEVFNTGIFDTIERSWKYESCSLGKLKVCAMKCGAEFDPFTEQWS